MTFVIKKEKTAYPKKGITRIKKEIAFGDFRLARTIERPSTMRERAEQLKLRKEFSQFFK